jgi:hypothetical protein
MREVFLRLLSKKLNQGNGFAYLEAFWFYPIRRLLPLPGVPTTPVLPAWMRFDEK